MLAADCAVRSKQMLRSLLEIISICFTLVEAGNKAQNDGEIRPQLTHMALKLGPNLLNLLGAPDSLRELTRFTSF